MFYRLSVVQLFIPPLSQRINDLFFLSSHFIDSYNRSMNREIIGIDEEVEDIFRRYTWPGNVRELKNVIEGAFNVSSSRFIVKKALPEYLVNAVNGFAVQSVTRPAVTEIKKEGFSLDRAVSEYEREIIVNTVKNTRTLTDAAKLLGITKQSLNYKLTKYGLSEK